MISRHNAFGQILAMLILLISVSAMADMGPYGGVHPVSLLDNKTSVFIEMLSIWMMLVFIVVIEYICLSKIYGVREHGTNLGAFVISLNVISVFVGFIVYRTDSLTIQSMNDYLLSFFATLVIELVVAIIYSIASQMSYKRRTYMGVVFANMVSYAFMLPLFILIQG